MRKYQQLLLAVLALFSFSCLLIYRHEYNKLRYVLEVLNFFGTPNMPVSSSLGYIENQPNNILRGSSTPAWQRISDSFYVYSAFWEKLGDTSYVKAYGVGTVNKTTNYQCYLWYEKDTISNMGLFDFSVLKISKQNSTYHESISGYDKINSFILHCKPKSEKFNVAPIGVTFFHKNSDYTKSGFIPVFAIKSNVPSQNSTGVCVMPTQAPKFNTTIILEFLTFHKIIGIDNFIIYGSIDHHKLLSSISFNKQNNVRITFLPWNYPFYEDRDIMLGLAEKDCKTRLKGLLENVVVLEWNKYLVPHYKLNISKLLNELNYENKVNKFLFTTLLFCTDNKDDNSSNVTLPMIFRNVKYFQPKTDSYVPIYKPHLESGSTQKIRKNIISVHHYAPCSNFKLKWRNIKNDIDMTMLKFKTDFFKSEIQLI